MNMEILEEFSASNDHIIAKGKRTKRPRSDSSSAAADFNCINSSPATSISTSTEEDEDLANCLILLARGQTEISSRKFAELATTTTAAKVGIFVYECKTCSRTFPSFQALGGHRASHKRPKIDREKEEADNEHRSKLGNLNTTIAPPPSTPPQLLAHVESKAKIHECSICGSEFASGQALGGHMRRHRSGPNTAVGRSDGDHSPSHDHRRAVLVEKTRSMLALDLNLPAPAEEAEFRGFSSKQQPRIIFPAAALVDCHY